VKSLYRTNHKSPSVLGTKIKTRGWKVISILVCLSMLLAACAVLTNPVTPSPFIPTASPTPAGPAAGPSPTPDNSPTTNATLVFDEEFSGTQLNTSNWATEYRWGPTNDPELQYYSPDALELSNGVLRIKADRRSMGGMDYTSGMIASYDRFTFTYGYVEIRAKLPAGQGLWPAFWMLLNDNNKTGEIDVFELLGYQPNTVYLTYHFPDSSGNSQNEGSSFTGPNFSQSFHIFGVDWEADKIVWYVDGVERYRATNNIPNGPMYLIANLAVGGNWPGNPDATTPFPAYYEIDYIRVYKH
jgi:beta-glucanase (GH16 family)